MKRILLLLVGLAFSAQVFAENPKVLLQTNYGDIIIELFPDEATVTVTNFLGYVDSGFYDGVIFHRVMNDFMIQTGGFDQNLEEKPPGPTIVNEFGRSNIRGTLAMAKVGDDPDSATSQFFINQADNSANLDEQNGGFTVFAQVIHGMYVVDVIAGVRAYSQYSPTSSWMNDVPGEPVIIEKAEIYDPSTRVFVSTSGSDTTGDGTFSNPYATIQKACDMAADNDYVILFPGTYTGPGNRDIDPGKPLLIRSMSPPDPNVANMPVIDCQADAQNMHRAFTLTSDPFTTTIKGLNITGGYHSQGGAIYAADASLVLGNCFITGNTATASGGALYCDNAVSVVSKTIMENNSAENGGAICNQDSTLELNQSRLLNNSASNGAGLYSDNEPELELSVELNNTIIAYNNASINGGGVYLQSGDMLVNNCNIVYNEAVSAGTALYDVGATATVKNSIIYGTILSIIHGSPNVTYSDVQGGYPGIGNIDTDPMFVDPVGGNYHLMSTGWRWHDTNVGWPYSSYYFTQPWSVSDPVTSRCVDAGDPVDGIGNESPIAIYDLFISKPYGANLRRNMGAYGDTKEASIPPLGFVLKSDYNNDGIVNLLDFAWLSQQWNLLFAMDELSTLSVEWLAVTSWHYSLTGDLNRNGIVDSDDLMLLAAGWTIDYNMNDFTTISSQWLETETWYVAP